MTNPWWETTWGGRSVRAFVPGLPRASGKADMRQLRAVDPVPCPELGKADTRSGQGTESAACGTAPAQTLVKAREFVPRVQRPRSAAARSGDCCIPLSSRGRSPRPDLSKYRLQLTFSYFRVVCHLRTQPVTARQAKEPTQAQVGIGGDGTPSSDDLADTLRRYVDLLGQSVPSNTHRGKELLQQKLPGCDWLEPVHSPCHLVIVDNLDVVGTCI